MKKLSKRIWLSVFIVFIMVSSTLGFIYSGNTETKNYNEYKFKRTDNGWASFIEKTDSYRTFSYLPNEVEDLGSVDLNSDFAYIVDDGNSGYGNSLKNIFSSAGIVSQIVSLNGNNNLPIVNCTNELPIFVLKSNLSMETKIYNDGKCVFIEGNLNKGIDFLAYTAYEVI